MSVAQSLTLTQQSQSVVNNCSIVKLLWTSTQSGQSYNAYTRTAYYWVSINGGAETQYSVSYTLPKSSTKTIAEVNITVPHNSDGTGSISVRTWMNTDISAGIVTKSASLTLTTIPRMSTLSVPGGELGVAQTLTIVKNHDSFNHTIVWVCGNMQGYVCQNSDATSIKWTPPITIASQNPTGTSVSVQFYINTYSPGVTDAIGTTSTNATYTIPESIAPYFAITKTDPKGHAETYGEYVQGQSRLNLVISHDNGQPGAASSYGAWITGYNIEFDGNVYTKDSFTSGAIVNSGRLPVNISVTDSRGRTTTETNYIDVFTYQFPTITGLSAYRSDQNKNPDENGEYISVSFSSKGISLEGGNTFTGKIQAKKTGEDSFKTEWEEIIDPEHSAIVAFQADPDSSYDILLTVRDDFKGVDLATVGASVKKVFSALKQDGDIVGWAFGKSAELPGVFDIGWQTRLNGGLLHPVLPSDTDLNTLLTPRTYMCLSANQYTNLPDGVISGFLEIVGIKDGSLIQRLSIFDKTNPKEYERIHYATTGWGSWICTRGDFVVEQGEKDGWTYRKWNSGVLECWKILTHTTAINTAWGALYCGKPTSRQSYPFPFTSKPVENVTLLCGGASAWLCADVGGDTGGSGGVNGAYGSACYTPVRPDSVSASHTFYLSFFVHGKWK